MPTNVTPEYKRAEDRFRAAQTPEEKIEALEEMLRVVPKHKGTDHLRADLKRRLSKLRETAGAKGGGKRVDLFHVPRGGAGQVVLLGAPNSGKSALVGALSRAKVQVADYPFSTAAPVPGMVPFEDVAIQLVDMPPITADFETPGQVSTYRRCDLIALVIDLTGDLEEQWAVAVDYLHRKHLVASDRLERPPAGETDLKPVVCLGTKVDQAGGGLLALLAETTQAACPFWEVSTVDGTGLEALPAKLFEWLDVVRIYAKPPGKPVDTGNPFTLPRGATVQDLARCIHRELAERLKTARIWGTGVYDGQSVQHTHVLHDRDAVELHFG